MKTLLIMRHAKSSWSAPGKSDFDRPLNERGRRTAPIMGQFIREKGFVPNLILSSTAARAKSTAELFADHSGYTGEIAFEKQFYLAHPDTYIEVLSWQDSPGAIMVIGHNPGLEQLVYDLTGESESMPTAAIAHVDLPIDKWSEIISAQGELIDLWRPKEL